MSKLALKRSILFMLESLVRQIDVTTLIPFLTAMESRLSKTYERVIADAGYESEENYAYLKENHQKGFIKPLNYETSKTRKYKAQLGETRKHGVR